MDVPPEISFKKVRKTPDIVNVINGQIAKLERIYPHLISCRVSVERRHQHEERGNPYRVRIEMGIPRRHHLVVKRDSTQGDMHDPLSFVIRNAFKGARRELESLKEKQQGQVKSHPQQEPVAFVERLYPDEGYGFLRTLDQREIYFHKNSVLKDDFGRLEVGTGVRFAEEDGEKGPQATTVEIVDKHGTT